MAFATMVENKTRRAAGHFGIAYVGGDDKDVVVAEKEWRAWKDRHWWAWADGGRAGVAWHVMTGGLTDRQRAAAAFHLHKLPYFITSITSQSNRALQQS